MSTGRSQKNLSDKRGNTLGITLLKWMMHFPGVSFTCAFIWVISFFYVLFDRQGKKQASYYLKHRFPEDGAWKQFFHTWTLFTSQGQSLLQAWGLHSGKINFECLHFERYKEQLEKGKGAIFLCSHFGSWQGMMRMIGYFDKPVYILAKPDRNQNVAKSMAVNGQEKIIWISTESPMGGLLDVYDALMEGNPVCIMGDRCLENEGIRIPFLGGEALFPTAAFQMAIQAQVEVFPVFSFRKNSFRQITLDIFESISFSPDLPRKERIKHSLAQYCAILEKMALQYPYECYIFENIWRHHENP